MKISNSTFVYFNYTLDEAIRRTADAGFDGVDIWGGRPHAYRRDLTPEDRRRVSRLVFSLNLQVVSVIPAQFRYPTSLCSNNESIRQDSVAYIQEGVITAADLGAPVVSVCPGHSVFGQGKEDAWNRLGESLDAISRFAQAYDVRIAIETADQYETDILNTTTQAMTMINQLGHDNLGVLVDTGHLLVVGESSSSAVRDLGSRLFHVHVDDNNGVRDQHLVPGEGKFNFDQFVDALRGVGYTGFLSAELSWDYTIDPDTAAKATAAKLRSLLD
jgi:protein FrlC